MKKLIAIVFVICLVVSKANVVYADGYTDEQLKHGPDIESSEYTCNLSMLQENIESEYLSMNNQYLRIAYPIIEQVRLDVPLCRQESSSYCGPASVQMVLAYKGISVTQSDLASRMHTDYNSTDGSYTGDGTYVYRIRNGLNYYLGSGTYNYVLTSSVRFFNGLRYSLSNDLPVVCHVMTGTLPIYRDYNVNSGHYIVATGYDYVAQSANSLEDVTTIYYNDPHYSDTFFGYRSCSLDEMVTAINNNARYYIMSGN